MLTVCPAAWRTGGAGERHGAGPREFLASEGHSKDKSEPRAGQGRKQLRQAWEPRGCSGGSNKQGSRRVWFQLKEEDVRKPRAGIGGLGGAGERLSLRRQQW